MNKGILKFIFLSLLSVLLLYGIIYSYKISDPFGLTFAVVTLPCIILFIIVVFIAIKTFISLIKNDNIKSNKLELVLIFIPFIIAIGFLLFSVFTTNSIKIPENYIAIFHGSSDKTNYKTYIYKIDTEEANYGFSYINTTNDKITDKGKVDWTDNVFEVAKENKAYSYVTLPNNDKKYTIDEYSRMFLMN